MNLKWLSFLFLFLLVTLSSCRGPKDLVFRDFKNLKIEKIGFAGALLKVDLVYYNPNNFGLELNRTDVDVFIDSSYLGHSSQEIQVAIPKRSDFTIPLSIDLDMKNLIKNGLMAAFNKNINVRILGKVKVGKAGVYKIFNVDYTTVQNFSFFK